jgi:ankyrin repeat protein
MVTNTLRAPDLDNLIDAARRGDAVALSGSLVDVDPNRHDAHGWTPLLWAAARGHRDAVVAMLDHPAHPADVALGHGVSGGLPVHLAGHSGDVDTVLAILDRSPDQLDAVWQLNGHSVLLQAIFYGHLALAEVLLARGADLTITTARGLGPLELARQFQNEPLMRLLAPHDAPAQAKAAYYQGYLARIAPAVPAEQRQAQDLADRLVRVIEDGLGRAAADTASVDDTLAQLRSLLDRGADVNRLAGPLQQPALVVVSSGNNGWPANPAVARLRLAVADLLLERGADPLLCERHPMGAQTIIRAAVFNHLEILERCAQVLTAEQLADGINMIPAVNGLTAMHDTVLRATMAGPDRIAGYLSQAAFFVARGGRVDLEDFAGVTQRQLADREPDPQRRRRLVDVLEGRLT